MQDRITIAFGNAYGLAIASKEGCYTKVSMHLPQIYGTKEIQEGSTIMKTVLIVEDEKMIRQEFA